MVGKILLLPLMIAVGIVGGACTQLGQMVDATLVPEVAIETDEVEAKRFGDQKQRLLELRARATNVLSDASRTVSAAEIEELVRREQDSERKLTEWRRAPRSASARAAATNAVTQYQKMVEVLENKSAE